MRHTPLFKGLTRPVSFAGLPANYLIVLGLIVMGGFVITTSIIYFFCSAAIGYLILRVIAAIDVYFFDVVFVVFQRTPITTSIVQGKGLTYRA